jgi:pyrroloquinoline quinone (PQQ) biosynthesis protein C
MNLTSKLSLISSSIKGEDLLKDVAFVHARKSRLSFQQWTKIVQEYYAFSEQFPNILLGLAKRIQDPYLNYELHHLVEIEEGNNGEPKHSELFLRFAQSINISYSTATLGPCIPETISFLNWLRQTYATAPIAYALGAQFSFEVLGNYIIQGFCQLLKHHPELSGDSIEYFLIHSEAEPEHEILMERCLSLFLNDDRQLKIASEGSIYCKKNLASFWNKMWESCILQT